MKCDNCKQPVLSCDCDEPVVFGVPMKSIVAGIQKLSEMPDPKQTIRIKGYEIPVTVPEGILVSMEECMEIIFPFKDSRPDKRTWLSWRDNGYIPYTKPNRRIFYDPARVKKALEENFERNKLKPK